MEQWNRVVLSGVLFGYLAGVTPIVAADPAPPTVAVQATGQSADDELRQEIAALRKRLEQLEQRLEQRAPAQPPAVQLKGHAAADGEEAPAPPPTAQSLLTRAGSRLEIGGFVSVRVTNIGNTLGDRTPSTSMDFQVARFRPRLAYIMDEHWRAEVDLNASTRSADPASFSARDLYIQHQNHWLQSRLGQSKLPFGYEVYVEGDTARIEMERARVMSVLFPDERDLGVFVRTVPTTATAAWAAVAAYNGNGINRMDNNNGKNFAGTVKVPLSKEHTVGVSGNVGSFRPSGPRTFERTAAGVEHQFTSGRFVTKAEALVGRDRGADIWGGYAGARYYTGVPGGLFARYDVFDPNRKALDNVFQRVAMGWYKNLTPKIRLTAEYDWVQNPLVDSDDTYAVQLQSIF